jgi:hypothetical protein
MVLAWQADTNDILPVDTIDVFCSSEACTSDTRFVSEIWQTTKVIYVSIEVPTKSRISLDLKPLQTITKI